MTPQPRIEKSTERNLADLEGHLYLLRENLRGLRSDAVHIKVLAAELRTLLCFSSGTEGLLWRLADEFGVNDKVILHVTGAVNPDHPLARGLKFAVVFIQRPGPHADPKLPPAASYSLQELIKQAQAVWVLGMRGYTHESLIKAVAQQAGSAHEDKGLEPGLSAIEDILIQGVHPYVPLLAIDAELAIEVGERVIAAAEASGKYRRRRFSKPVTMSIHVRLRELPAGAVAIARFEAPISGISVTATMTPLSVTFSVTKEASRQIELETPLPADWEAGQDAVFSLTYEHERKRLQALSSGRSGDVAEPCDLGFVEGDLRPTHMPEGARPFVERVAVYLHEKLLTALDLVELPNILLEPPRIQ